MEISNLLYFIIPIIISIALLFFYKYIDKSIKNNETLKYKKYVPPSRKKELIFDSISIMLLFTFFALFILPGIIYLFFLIEKLDITKYLDATNRIEIMYIGIFIALLGFVTIMFLAATILMYLMLKISPAVLKDYWQWSALVQKNKLIRKRDVVQISDSNKVIVFIITKITVLLASIYFISILLYLFYYFVFKV